MSALEQTGPMHNTSEFTNSTYWESNEKYKAEKAKERKEAEEALKAIGVMK